MEENLMTKLDEKSLEKAKSLFSSKKIEEIEVGSLEGLREIHRAFFEGLFDFAGEIRTVNKSLCGGGLVKGR